MNGKIALVHVLAAGSHGLKMHVSNVKHEAVGLTRLALGSRPASFVAAVS